MASEATIGTAPPRHANVARAGRLVWLLLGGFVFTVVVGLSWDRAWHARNAFDSFWSPPHLFIYTMALLCAGLAGHLATTPSLRRAFGPGLPVPLVGARVPGALLLLGGGFGLLALAGLLDYFWHTAYGLDETQWSTPHALIAWALLTVVLGCVAAWRALPREGAPSWRPTLTLSLALLVFSLAPLGPLHRNRSPMTVRAVAAVPVLAAQPAFQHTTRIYLEWNINRAHPLLVPLGALWAGAVLAALRGLDRRPAVWLSAIAVWTLFELVTGHGGALALARLLDPAPAVVPADWLPLPLLPAGLVLGAMLWARAPARWAWSVAGFVYGIVAWLVWRAAPGLALVALAAPALWLGAWLGGAVTDLLARPTRRAVGTWLGVALAWPVMTGLLDLYLRLHTP